MPKRFTDAEINKIISEASELRDYVKNLIANTKQDEQIIADIHSKLSNHTEQLVELSQNIINQNTIQAQELDRLRGEVNILKNDLNRLKVQQDNGQGSSFNPDRMAYELMETLRHASSGFVQEFSRIISEAGRRGGRYYEPRFDPGYNDRIRPVSISELEASFDNRLKLSPEDIKNIENDGLKINDDLVPFKDIAKDIEITPKKLKGGKKF